MTLSVDICQRISREVVLRFVGTVNVSEIHFDSRPRDTILLLVRSSLDKFCWIDRVSLKSCIVWWSCLCIVDHCEIPGITQPALRLLAQNWGQLSNEIVSVALHLNNKILFTWNLLKFQFKLTSRKFFLSAIFSNGTQAHCQMNKKNWIFSIWKERKKEIFSSKSTQREKIYLIFFIQKKWFQSKVRAIFCA